VAGASRARPSPGHLAPSLIFAAFRYSNPFTPAPEPAISLRNDRGGKETLRPRIRSIRRRPAPPSQALHPMERRHSCRLNLEAPEHKRREIEPPMDADRRREEVESVGLRVDRKKLTKRQTLCPLFLLRSPAPFSSSNFPIHISNQNQLYIIQSSIRVHLRLITLLPSSFCDLLRPFAATKFPIHISNLNHLFIIQSFIRVYPRPSAVQNSSALFLRVPSRPLRL